MNTPSKLRQLIGFIAKVTYFHRLNSKQWGVILAELTIPVVFASWLIAPPHLSGQSLTLFLLFFSLSILISLFPVKISGENISLTTTLPMAIATTYVYGPFAATMLAISCTFVHAIWVARGLLSDVHERRRVIWSCVHNCSHVAISVAIPSIAYEACLRYGLFTPHSVYAAGALCFASIIDFYINAILLTILVSKWFKMRWDVVWYNNYRWTFASTVLLSPLGFLMGALTDQSIWLGLLFIVIPVVAMHQGYLLHEKRITTYRQGIELLGKLMQESHPYTHGHLNRVARWAVKIAEGLKLPAESMSHIENAAVLHDIGKIGLDDRILNKVEKLTDDEWARIKEHPVVGAEIAARMQYLDQVSLWIRHHHERIDGKGYPNGLVGDDIPVESKIICVVDAFDAMVGGPSKADQRPYREPKTMEEARAELVRCSNTQFDEAVVQCFLEVLDAEDVEAGLTYIMQDDLMEDVPQLTLVGQGSSTDHIAKQLRLKGAA